MEEHKEIIDIPSREEIFLEKFYTNKKYHDYILDAIKFDNLLEPYNMIEILKNNKEDFYEDKNFLYSKKTFPEENIRDFQGENNFYYKINKQGFRSKVFEDFDKNKTNVLFAGCSVTFGCGLPEGMNWADFLVNKMKKEFTDNIDHYNISLPGASVFLNVKNILSFINSVGIPDIILMALPETTRSLYWDEEAGKFAHALMSSNFREVDKKYRNGYIQENNLMINLVSIQFIEMLCKNLNINLAWTSWNMTSSDLYKQFNFNNFFEMHFKHTLSIVPPRIFNSSANFKDHLKNKNEYEKNLKMLNDLNKNNLPFWEVARDYVHPGTCFSEFYSEEFLKEIKDKNFFIID